VEEKVLTLDPEGKQGVYFSKEKYTVIREAILSILVDQGEILFKDLPAAVDRQLQGNFDGLISWYVTTVKLDLEARKLIVRVAQSRPQRLRLGT
jgi:hypothetical protein